MAAYLAYRIEKGKLKYKAVIKIHPELKDEIDEILIADGKEDLIEE